MSETARYLKHLTKVTADVYRATVLEALPNNVYTVQRIDSKATRYAKGNGFYRVGSWVDVQSASASGNVVGSMDTITTPAAERGMSETTPSTRTETVARTLIFSVDPDPLELEAGGDAGEQVILGVGLASAGAYVHPDDDDPPTIEDAEAPVIESTKVTRTIRAAVDSVIGLFDLMLDGIRVPKCLRVVPHRVPETLYVLSGSGTLYALDARSLDVIATYPGAAGSGSCAIDRKGVLVIVCGETDLFIVDPRDGSTTTVPVTWPADTPPYLVTRYGGPLWFRAAGATTDLAAVGLIGGTESQVTTYPVSVGDPVTPYACVANFAGIIWACDVNARLIRFNTADLSVSFVAMPEPTDVPFSQTLVTHKGALYAAGALALAGGANKIYRRDATTGAALSEMVLAAHATCNTRSIVSCGGKLFALTRKPYNAPGETHNRIAIEVLADDLSGFTNVGEIVGAGPSGTGAFTNQVVAGENAFYLTEASLGDVYRVDATTYAITSEVIDAAGVDTAFVYRL